MVRRLVLPFAALTCLSAPALAQSPLAVRVRPPVAHDIYDRAAAAGPVVLPVSPDAGPMPFDPAGLMVIRAVPVVAVIRGGAFGPTGFGYYNDGMSEGPLNRPRHLIDDGFGSRAY